MSVSILTVPGYVINAPILHGIHQHAHLPAQNIVNGQTHPGLFGQLILDLRSRVERIGKVPEQSVGSNSRRFLLARIGNTGNGQRGIPAGFGQIRIGRKMKRQSAVIIGRFDGTWRIGTGERTAGNLRIGIVRAVVNVQFVVVFVGFKRIKDHLNCGAAIFGIKGHG